MVLLLEHPRERGDGDSARCECLPQRGRGAVEPHVAAARRVEHDDIVEHGLRDHAARALDDGVDRDRHAVNVTQVAAAGTLFGYGIRSVFSHERLSPAPAGRGTIEIGECAAVTLDESVVVHRMDDGEMSFAIGRAADGTLAIECSAAGGFRLDAAGMLVQADRRPPGDELWEHRLVSVALPLLL